MSEVSTLTATLMITKPLEMWIQIWYAKIVSYTDITISEVQQLIITKK